jgi:subtilisin family serine protease
MSKKKSTRRLSKQSQKNRGQLQYTMLEVRQVLASLVANPFVVDAFPLTDVAARAADHPYMDGEVVVALSSETSQGPNAVASVNWRYLTGVSTATPIKTILTSDRGDGTSVSLVHVDLGDGADVIHVMNRLDRFSRVMWSSPNFYQTIDPREYTPNDPLYSDQYHHPLMQNDLAWDITRGSPDIIVAVTDDGFDLFHPDLQENIWTNPLEIMGDGNDNDGNGYVDDVNGWNFVDNNNNPNPSFSFATHGTHVAGIAAGRMDNGLGITGVAGLSTIMPLKFYNYGIWTSTMTTEAFTYATDNGAHIVNTSYNIDGFVGDPLFATGLQYMYDNGVLHFNSAGNNSQLNPPRQAFENTLIVASTDNADQVSGFSNYGTGIDISAPGSDILSSVFGGSWDYFSGTSMATPNAAGAAALIWSAHPTWTRDQVAASLLYFADNIDAQNPDKIGLMGAGRVNTFRSITGTMEAPQLAFLNGLPPNNGTTDDLTISNFSFGFDQVMDPASVNDPSNIELRSTGLDNVFDTPDDIVYTLNRNPYMLGTNSLSASIAGGPLSYGTYRLRFTSGGLQNPFGMGLDGNKDGSGGDNYDHIFSIGFLGSVNTIEIDSNWTKVNLPVIFKDPVIVAGPASFNGADPVTVRVRNITRGSFEIAIDEWDYRDGTHGKERVSYIAMEAGHYDLGNGVIMEAGNVVARHRWADFNFITPFNNAPVVISQIGTTREPSAATTRMRNITETGFSIRIQEEQGSDFHHANEKIGYIAFEKVAGEFQGLQVEAGVTPNAVTHRPYTIDYTSAFPETPAFFAAMQTYNGGDPATVRVLNSTKFRARVFLEEERSYDAEINHNPEVVGFISLEVGSFRRPSTGASPLANRSEFASATPVVTDSTSESSLLSANSAQVPLEFQLSTADVSLSADDTAPVANGLASPILTAPRSSQERDSYFASYLSIDDQDGEAGEVSSLDLIAAALA